MENLLFEGFILGVISAIVIILVGIAIDFLSDYFNNGC